MFSNAQREPDQGAPQKKSDDITTDAPNHIQDPVLDPVPRAGTVTAAVQEIDTTGTPTAIVNVNVIRTTDGAVILDRAVIRVRVRVLLIPTVIIDSIHLDTTIAVAAAAVRTRDLPPGPAEGHTVAAGVVIDEVPVETSIMKPGGLYAPWHKTARIMARSMKTPYGSGRRATRNIHLCGRIP